MNFAEWWIVIVMGGFVWCAFAGMWPVPQLLDRIFVRKDPAKCHKSNHGYAWGGFAPCNCGRSPNHWIHWPKRLEPHKFKAHVRKDMHGPEVMRFCDLCSKRKGYKMHKLPLPVSAQVQDLEKWHLDFRKKHPEYEDSVRNEIFPELLDAE